jgi:DNA polymerase elongation subunit (family B)
MPTLFHIIDAIVEDVEGGAPVVSGNLSDDDAEIRKVNSRYKKKESEYKSPDKLSLNIYLFGKTADGQSVRASIEGFEPFFYVRLPAKGRKIHSEFEKALGPSLKPWLRGLVKVEYDSAKTLYGYTGGADFPFVKLSAPSLTAFRALRKVFLDPDFSKPIFELGSHGRLEVYEANLDPMLRFFHLRNIKPCGWVTVDAEIDNGELSAPWDSISPATPPVASAPFLMAAWDIECYSANGEFTLATKNFDRLARQLYAHSSSSEEAAAHIVAAATGTPIDGMDAITVQGKLDLNRLRESLTNEIFLDGLTPLLSAKDGLSQTTKEDRIREISTVLMATLKNTLRLAGDPVIQIGTVLVVNGVTTEKHIFVQGSCDPVPGAKLHVFPTEKQLIIGWSKAMCDWNPDILMGYNVFGYDERYMWERAKELGITGDPFIQGLSRMIDKGRTLELEKKMLSSSAMGDNMLYMWTTHGRLQIDLFHYVKRNYNLPAYKLDYVCQHFMSGKCSAVDVSGSVPGVWRIKTKNTADVIVGRYLVLLDETGDTVVDKLRITGIEDGVALEVQEPDCDDLDDLRASVADAVKWAVVKDDVSPQDIFRLHREGPRGRSRVAAYCVQDCDLTVELFKKLDVFNNAMAMANTCSVPVGYIFTRGQGVKIESLIFKECYQRGFRVLVLPTTPRRPDDYIPTAEEVAAQDSYEGAIVLTPKPGFYFKSPIGVADFASLYPSTIISENISYDTLVWVKNYAIDAEGRPTTFIYEYGSEEAERSGVKGEAWTDIEFDVWGVKEGDTRKVPEKVKRGLRICRYAQADRGTLPLIVEGLLAARKAKRKEAAAEEDPFKKALLDAEQLAYKLTANSLYGQLGSSTFKIRLQHLAASVTAYGRKQILFAKAAIERFYGPVAKRRDCAAEIIYGDTDSLFVDFKVMNPETGAPLEGEAAIKATMHLTEEAGKMVTTCLKAPHDFEYDKTFSPFIIFSKKRYVGNKYEESSTEYYQNSMGIATKRRDYAGIVKVIYGGALRILLSQKDVMAAAQFVKGKLLDLANGRVSMNQLTLTKALKSDYKAAPAHKILAERITLRDPGNAPASGDRISFLYVLPGVGQQASKLQGERIETPAYIKQKGLSIDMKYYMEHQLMNPLSQLFALIVEQLRGCVAPGGRSWANADDSDREYAATEYLFRDALNLCDKLSTQRYTQKMFGITSSPAAVTPNRVPRKLTPAPKYIQQKLTSVTAQMELMKQMEKAVPRRSPRNNPKEE